MGYQNCQMITNKSSSHLQIRHNLNGLMLTEWNWIRLIVTAINTLYPVGFYIQWCVALHGTHRSSYKILLSTFIPDWLELIQPYITIFVTPWLIQVVKYRVLLAWQEGLMNRQAQSPLPHPTPTPITNPPPTPPPPPPRIPLCKMALKEI